jgi:hypothetical protein
MKAAGGIATKRTLAEIAEGGVPEAVIPLTDKNLRILAGGDGKGNQSFSFNPVINVAPGAKVTKEELQQWLEEFWDQKIMKEIQTGLLLSGEGT